MKNKVKNRLKPKKYDHWQEYQKVKKRAYRIVGGATVAVWVLLLIIKLAVAARSGLPFSEAFRTIGDGIFDNILGILPPILLFDFGLEYIQQDKVYEEMTEQITGTIMSRPEVINSFDFDAKKRFVDATVLSMVDMDKDECAMALGAIEPYLMINTISKPALNILLISTIAIALIALNPKNICLFANSFRIILHISQPSR